MPSNVNPIENDQRIAAIYEFLGELGSGGMGTVYQARHKLLRKSVAIKVINARVASRKTLERFRLEGEAAGRLNHPGIVQVHDLNVSSDGHPYLIMDYVDGKSLDLILQESGALSLDRFYRIFSDVCDALQHAHENKVLHRDIKPNNIMICRESGRERAKILDFGIAKLLDAETGGNSLTQTGDAIGSPTYMSPEQGFGKPLDYRSDIYSLGCSMYEALAGAPPFIGKTPYEVLFMHANNPPPSLHEGSLGTKFPQALEAVVMKCLAKEPADRFSCVAEITAALARTKRGDSAAAMDASKAGSGSLFRGWIPAAAGLSVIVAAASIVTIVSLPHTKTITSVSGAQQHTTDKATRSAALGDSLDSRSVGEEAMSAIDNLSERHDFVGSDELSAIGADDTRLRELMSKVDPLRILALNLSSAKLSDEAFKSLLAFKNLHQLNLNGVSLGSADFLSSFKSLKKLELAKCSFDEPTIDAAVKIPSLEKIDLSYTEVTPQQIEKLGKLPCLREVILTGCKKITEDNAYQLMLALPEPSIYKRQNMVRFGRDTGLFAHECNEIVEVLKRTQPPKERLKTALDDLESLHLSGEKTLVEADIYGFFVTRERNLSSRFYFDCLNKLMACAPKTSYWHPIGLYLMGNLKAAGQNYEAAFGLHQQADVSFSTIKHSNLCELYLIRLYHARNALALAQECRELRKFDDAEKYARTSQAEFDKLNMRLDANRAKLVNADAIAGQNHPRYALALDDYKSILDEFANQPGDEKARALLGMANVCKLQSETDADDADKKNLRKEALGYAKRVTELPGPNPKLRRGAQKIIAELLKKN